MDEENYLGKHKPDIPEGIDLLVVGSGTAGAALAGIIARDTDLNVFSSCVNVPDGPRE